MSNIYSIFESWLFDENQTISDLDDSVVKGISQLALMRRMLTLGDFTVYLNDKLNTFELMKFDKKDFFNFIKTSLRDMNIKRRDLSFYKYSKSEKLADKIRNKFPLLKSCEIPILLDLLSENEHDTLMEQFGISETKIKKLTKSEKSQNKGVVKTDKPDDKNIIPTSFADLKRVLIENKQKG